MLFLILLKFEEREIVEFGVLTVRHLGYDFLRGLAIVELREVFDHTVLLGFITSVFSVKIHNVRIRPFLE